MTVFPAGLINIIIFLTQKYPISLFKSDFFYLNHIFSFSLFTV